jgi:hypothetical protein
VNSVSVVVSLNISNIPSSARRGGRDIKQNIAKPPYNGADGVVGPAKLQIGAELTTLKASRYRARASRPSARDKVASRLLIDAQPPLLCEEGNISFRI